MRKYMFLAAAIAIASAMFVLPNVSTAAPPLDATVLFGDPNAGSPFPPPAEHDSSFHAADKMVPRTAVVSQGGTVTFDTFGVHQVAVYDAGTKPGDINAGILTPPPVGPPACPPVPLIDDPNGRLSVLADQPCAGGDASPQFTFSQPGRYLIICTFRPHFTDADMYGYVIVK